MKRISTVGPKSGGGDGYLRPDQFLDHLTVIKKHSVSRIVQSNNPAQICCVAVVAKQKIQVFVLFDYFGEFIVPFRGKWLLKGVPKMLSKTT